MDDRLFIEDLKSYEDLSYNDYADDYVEVLHKNYSVGNAEVFTDSSHTERKGSDAEYIIINDEIIYLNSIKKN